MRIFTSCLPEYQVMLFSPAQYFFLQVGTVGLYPAERDSCWTFSGFFPLEYDEGASTNTTSLRSFCTQEPSVEMVSQRPHQQDPREARKQEDAAISAMRMGCH